MNPLIYSVIHSFIYLSIHPFIHCSFVCSFVHLLIHSFILHSLTHLSIYSFIYPFIHSFVHSHIHSFIHPLVYSFVWNISFSYSFIHTVICSSIHPLIHFIHSFFCSLIHSFFCSLIYSFISLFIQSSINLLIPSFVHSCIYSSIGLFISSFIHSLIQPSIHSVICNSIHYLNHLCFQQSILTKDLNSVWETEGKRRAEKVEEPGRNSFLGMRSQTWERRGHGDLDALNSRGIEELSLMNWKPLKYLKKYVKSFRPNHCIHIHFYLTHKCNIEDTGSRITVNCNIKCNYCFMHVLRVTATVGSHMQSVDNKIWNSMKYFLTIFHIWMPLFQVPWAQRKSKVVWLGERAVFIVYIKTRRSPSIQVTSAYLMDSHGVLAENICTTLTQWNTPWIVLTMTMLQGKQVR